MNGEEQSAIDVSETPEVKYSAFVSRGRVCVLGLANTSCGPVPLASYADVAGDCEDGPIHGEPAENVKAALEAALTPMQASLATATMRAGAESLVLRARSGDQNAMAILALVGKEAREGNERAKVAARLVYEYCQSHPEVPLNIGSDETDDAHPVLIAIAERRRPLYAYPLALATYLADAPPDMRTVVCLANGPALTRDILFQVADCMSSEQDSEAFMTGVQHAHNARKMFQVKDQFDEGALRAGRMCAQAMAIQRFRLDGRADKFCAEHAWEIGADAS